MTIEQILDDIKSPRVKKCILDSDMYNEMDDQYALAYCLGSEKIELLSVNAAPFYNGRSVDFETGMVDSYNETLRMYDYCGVSVDDIPVYEGSRVKFTPENGYAPIDSPAARNIIKTVKESEEIIYVITTGCCSNVTSACLIDPSIKDNMCVIWLGGHELNHRDCHEFNLSQDYAAGQLLLNCGVPLVMLPADGPKGSLGGTIQLYITVETLKGIKGDGKAQKFFREELPAEYLPNEDGTPKIAEWDSNLGRVLWDIAAPAVLNIPDTFDFKIVPTPIFGDDKKYAFDQTRHKMIYMNRLNRERVLEDAFKCISRV